AMSGASPRHVLIVTNLVRELSSQLKNRPCLVFSTDLRLRVSATGLFTYPDVMVTCGRAAYVDEQQDTLTNPTLIVEVLSDSTEDYDRGRKFEHYRSLASLQEYVLVAQDRVHLEQFQRQPDGRWLLSETRRREDAVRLSSIDCDLALDEVYGKVDLPTEPSPGTS
ncbi:MAG TPA: Uma2 family endonuclease, partial [Vicinamibacteria bacterium]|nr:Uma2 family endonuclease [Vicinamibacteria bacterium]